MKKKNIPRKVANLICAIVQVAALYVFVFEDYFSYTKEIDVIITSELLEFISGPNGYFGFLGALKLAGIQACVSVAFMILGIVMCVVSALRNEQRKDGVSHTVVSVLALGTVAITLLTVSRFTDGIEYMFTFSLNRTALTLMCLLGAAIVCNMLKRSKLFNPKETPMAETTTPADELQRYKELLDSGIKDGRCHRR